MSYISLRYRIKTLFGRLKQTHLKASVWEKCSFGQNPLSVEYETVKEVVYSAQAAFQVRFASTCITDDDLIYNHQRTVLDTRGS